MAVAEKSNTAGRDGDAFPATGIEDVFKLEVRWR